MKLRQPLINAISGRRFSAVLLASSVGAHLFCAYWILSTGTIVFKAEFLTLLLLSAALGICMFLIRRIVVVRVVAVVRISAILIALRLTVEPPLVIPALLLLPVLIEPVLYDSQRIGIGISALFFAAILVTVFVVGADGIQNALLRIAAFTLITGLPSALGWLLVSYRERIVLLTGRLRYLDNAVLRLSEANREYQVYAGTVRSESAAEERNRITGELHDTVGYALTNIMIMMDVAKTTLRQDPDSLESIIDKARDQSERTLNETRQILHRLRSVEEVERTGIDAISQLASAYKDAMGIKVELSMGNLKPSFGHRIDSALFRLVQEGLTNAFRHGNATKVRILMWQTADEIRVSVRDNGSGVFSEINASDGIGISGMTERFSKLGGVVRARKLSDGFELSGSIPYITGEIFGSNQGAHRR